MSAPTEETPLTAPEETPSAAPEETPASTTSTSEKDDAKSSSTKPGVDFSKFEEGAKVAAAKTAEVSKVAAAKTVEYSKKGAVIAQKKAQEVAEFVMDGPIGFRLLAFIGGVGVLWLSIVDMVEEYLLINPWQTIAAMYNVFFGGIMILMESTAVCRRTPWRNDLYESANFLRTTFGRGVFYVFVGINMTAQHFSWPSFYTGIYVLGVGGIYVCVGYWTQKKISKLRAHLKDEEAVSNTFDEMDKDESGALDPEEFAQLCESLGVPMKKVELLAVFDVIDTSDVGERKNRITKDEFLHWWSEWDELAEVV